MNVRTIFGLEDLYGDRTAMTMMFMRWIIAMISLLPKSIDNLIYRRVA